MNGKSLLTLAALLGVILGGLWYHNTYMCCCDGVATNTTAGASKAHLPYYFNAAKDKTMDLGDGFGKYADSLQRNYGSSDTVKIVGYYYNGEDSTFGMDRANALKTNLTTKMASAIYVTSAQKVGNDSPNGEYPGAIANIVKSSAPVAKDVTTSVMTDGKLILYFPTGSTAEKFDAATEANIKNVIEASKQAGKTIKVDGHTDNKGDANKNLTLSKGRADRVKAILVQRGANAAIISTEGFGQTKPIDAADNDAARSKNRRVEVKVN
jgi:outer membrane protein OmpA-like peptidoglycan-associated protein